MGACGRFAFSSTIIPTVLPLTYINLLSVYIEYIKYTVLVRLAIKEEHVAAARMDSSAPSDAKIVVTTARAENNLDTVQRIRFLGYMWL